MSAREPRRRRDSEEVSEGGMEEKLIALNRVQKVHKGGRTLRWSALVVVGDGNGQVGVGLGKSTEVPEAVRKANEDARKNVIQFARLGSTIPHAVECRYGAARVLAEAGLARYRRDCRRRRARGIGIRRGEGRAVQVPGFR